VIYPIKTLNQLSLVLKGFRKEKGLTQAEIAERLGITQQSYAHFEANPAKATLERFYMVLRLLDVEISLNQTSPVANKRIKLPTKVIRESPPMIQNIATAVAVRGKKPSAVAKVKRIVAPTKRKESW
jgi:HTH-type transcriptional regulator/antitoxin HipB